MNSISKRSKRGRWWRRETAKNSRFKYRDAGGSRISDSTHLARIASRVIPPAGREVRINPSAGGRLQAIGIDKAGRTQYLYNHSYQATTQRLKFEKIERFGLALPRLRQLVNEHLALDNLSRDKVLAIVVRLIDALSFRIGSEMNVRRYRTYGLTTLRNRHVTVNNDFTLKFRFIGKHHILQKRVLNDGELAEMVTTIRSLPGPVLLQYKGEDGKPHRIRPQEVNQYIKDAMGRKRVFRAGLSCLGGNGNRRDRAGKHWPYN